MGPKYHCFYYGFLDLFVVFPTRRAGDAKRSNSSWPCGSRKEPAPAAKRPVGRKSTGKQHIANISMGIGEPGAAQQSP